MNNYLIINLLLFFILFSCKRDFSVPDTREIQLTEESAEVTEIWLKFKVTPLDTEAYYTVLRDTHIVFNGKLEKEDTLLHDENLESNHTYKYSVQAKTGTVAKEFITTMDTTSHDFEWQIFEFGDHSSSYFSDIAIIDEDEIWAVGKIYTDSGDYNAAHWDGYKWNLKRFVNSNSVVFPIRGLHVFSNDDIWLAAGSIYHWDGNNAELSYLRDITTNEMVGKLWVNSANDIYGVGQSGIIVHYNGQTWQKIDSGTDENIQDIWGTIDQKSGEPFILCAASQVLQTSEKLLLEIKSDLTVNNFLWPYSNKKPYSIWYKDSSKLFACGSGIFSRNFIGAWSVINDDIKYFTNKIRGNHINDFFAVGAYGLIAHYSGLSWYIFPEYFNGSYKSVDVKDNLVVAVGSTSRKARIIMINRK